MAHKMNKKKKRDKSNIINTKKNSIISGDTGNDRYIYLMGLIGISPADARKDIADVEIVVRNCNWKGYCEKCGMVHIE